MPIVDNPILHLFFHFLLNKTVKSGETIDFSEPWTKGRISFIWYTSPVKKLKKPVKLILCVCFWSKIPIDNI